MWARGRFRLVSLKRHVITGEPILFAPTRASRPNAFTGDGETTVERCPFCPGNEADTPPEIERLSDGDRWIARVFPNKYPPIEGAEVIVEAPDHGDRFEEVAHAERIAVLYADRYRAHEDAAYTSIFKNQGTRAGSSIAHVHSQVIPLPFVPPRIARESEAFERAARCPLCNCDGVIIRETSAFAWLAPASSTFPYQQWLVPKRHVAEIIAFTTSELAELALLLREVSAATSRVASAFNWMLMNFPRVLAAHAYIEVSPRMTAIAGFELGTGTFVEIIDPAAAAESLR